MIVKGHDFPNVTLVGVLAADLSMFSGDYLAGERTFQLLTQAAGRAGRGEKQGLALIQTYQPDHYAIVCAAKQDYEAFYAQEILYRKLMNYPPAGNMMVAVVEHADEEAAKAAAEMLAGAHEGGRRSGAFTGGWFPGQRKRYLPKGDLYKKQHDERIIPVPEYGAANGPGRRIIETDERTV